MTGETLPKQVDVGQFILANYGLLAGNNPALDTPTSESDIELKR
jgi:hypothetical protein